MFLVTPAMWFVTSWHWVNSKMWLLRYYGYDAKSYYNRSRCSRVFGVKCNWYLKSAGSLTAHLARIQLLGVIDPYVYILIQFKAETNIFIICTYYCINCIKLFLKLFIHKSKMDSDISIKQWKHYTLSKNKTSNIVSLNW